MIFHRIYRKKFEIFDWLLNKIRILHLRFKYPKLILKGDCRIGKNCHIVCADSSSIYLDTVAISNGAHIVASNGGHIKISKSFIGSNSLIVSINKITIEENCELAEFVVIRDQDHKFNFSNNPIGEQGYESAPVVIESNVWVGAKATILKGVIVGRNSVVGAHSLVNKNIDSCTLVAGIPAKEIKTNK
tara:strand:- start:1672 stop:2235 length:564 start_codon:yes stop_codon:yes gene_type:complete